MKREDVYKLIDGERDYQDSLPNHSQAHDLNHSVGDWLIFMEHQIDKAKTAFYELDTTMALRHIRKATALGVVCMEYNDTPER